MTFMQDNTRLSKLFNRATIKRQLYMMYALVVVVPILLIGMLLLLINYRMMVNYHTDLLASDNRRVRSILFEITTQLYNISEDITFDKDVQQVLTGTFDTREAYLEAAGRIQVMESYLGKYAEISSIAIYTDNPSVSSYKQIHGVSPDIEDKEWYQKAMAQSGVFWLGITRKDEYLNEYWNLCLVRKIPLIDSPFHAVLVISLSDDYLRTRIDSGDYINMVSVDKGPVFYNSDRENYGIGQCVPIAYEEPYFQYKGRIKWTGQQSFVNVSTLHMYQSVSRIYISTFDEEGYKSVKKILYMCLIIIGVSIVIPGIMIHIFTDYFTGRVGLLRQEMHKASNQDYELIPVFQGQDELTEAFKDLQVMVHNIKKQEARVYEAQIKGQELLIKQQEMEFKVLASQINPHFLYNTLETIRMKAFTAGDKEAATSIKLLGKSMRYVLDNTGTTLTSLEEELGHVDNYMMIQSLRFGERICYEKQIEEGLALASYRLLPLLLQPVVENAIVHGLEDMAEGGRIRLCIYTKKMEKCELLYIDVTDNGCGMAGEELDKLRQDIETRDLARSKSIGLYNINRRMKLYYGDGWRIHIYSEPGRGTTVRLMFPTDKLLQS